MIEMTKICKIRQLRKAGESVAAIAEQEGVSRDTVYKYLAKDDFSPEVPKSSQVRGSKLDPYKPIIDSWLEDDAQKWRKQRHTREEFGNVCATNTAPKSPNAPSAKNLARKSSQR